MSAENVKWRVNMAVRASNLPPAARLVMLVLSDMADARTGVIPDKHCPSLASLARDTGHGESTVKAQLAELERLGWVIRIRPNAHERARHVPTRYRIQVGSAGDERPVLKRKPRARSKPSETAFEGQEQAIAEGQELTDRGPGASSSRARSKPSYIKEDDHNDPYDLFAADAAPAGDVEPPEPRPRKRSGATRKAAKPKTPDPLGDIAQELTVAFVEAHGKTNAQPFAAIRGVAKATLARNVPRDVLAAAMDAVADNGFPISGATLTVELNRMWKAANGQAASRRPGAADRIMADAREREQRYLAEEAAATGNAPNPFELLPGTAA